MFQKKAIFFLLFALSAVLLMVACDDTTEEIELTRWSGVENFDVEWRLNTLNMSTRFVQEAQAMGESTMPEASGIVPSIVNPGYLWSHNDKGNDNLLFLLDKANGATVARYRLDGILNRDWEDIEIGLEANGDTFIYLGEIGDNDRVYSNYTIHKFREPVFEEAHRGQVVNHEPVDHTPIRFTFEGGTKHDSEALLYDPIHKDLYIVTKRDFNSIIFAIPHAEDYGAMTEAKRIGTFRFTRAVGANVSLDGSEILLKTPAQIIHWLRDGDEPLWQTMMREPELVPYFPGEPQGEAICFDSQGESFYTLSEFSNGITPVLYFYERLAP